MARDIGAWNLCLHCILPRWYPITRPIHPFKCGDYGYMSVIQYLITTCSCCMIPISFSVTPFIPLCLTVHSLSMSLSLFLHVSLSLSLSLFYISISIFSLYVVQFSLSLSLSIRWWHVFVGIGAPWAPRLDGHTRDHQFLYVYLSSFISSSFSLYLSLFHSLALSLSLYLSLSLSLSVSVSSI